jgi:hypothetical protein
MDPDEVTLKMAKVKIIELLCTSLQGAVLCCSILLLDSAALCCSIVTFP